MKKSVYVVIRGTQEHGDIPVCVLGKRQEAETFLKIVAEKCDELIFKATGTMGSESIPTTFLDVIEDGEPVQYMVCHMKIK